MHTGSSSAVRSKAMRSANMRSANDSYLEIDDTELKNLGQSESAEHLEVAVLGEPEGRWDREDYAGHGVA